LGLLAAAFAASLADLLPIAYVGWILSFIVRLVLISKFTTAETWPDAALIVVIVWGLAAPANLVLKIALR
jgi:hypothetical protein